MAVAQRRERLDGVVDDGGHGLLAQLELLAAGLHAPPVEQALDAAGEPLGLAAEAPRGTCRWSAWSVARALHRLGEEADARQRGAKLVADLRDEVGLELAEVGLAPEEDEHEHDAR